MIAQHIVGLFAVIKAAFVGASPVRVIEHDIAIIMVWRISSNARFIQIAPEELFTAG